MMMLARDKTASRFPCKPYCPLHDLDASVIGGQLVLVNHKSRELSLQLWMHMAL